MPRLGVLWANYRRELGRPRRRRVPQGISLLYGRHFMLLACCAVVLALTSRWRPPSAGAASIKFSFALYGALHATALVSALRASQAVGRKLLFIAIASSISMLSAMLCLYAIRSIGVFPRTFGGASGLLALISGLGAAGYAVLVRQFWISDLPVRALASITLGCILGTLLVLMSGMLLKTMGVLGFAVCWWFAFSGSLWFQDGT